MDLILFLILAVVAIATALGMLVSRNAVYSALFLVLNFATVAVFYLLLGAPFIALTQVTVYAGAIMVLFLFVIMLLGTDELPERKVLNWQKPMAIFLALVLMAEGVYLIFIQKSASGLINNAPGADFGSPQAIGDMLFNKYLLPFEVTSILLLVAMVGAIVLTGNMKGGQS
ncbi:MAG: NADH-quinone oxidoreductase subunit J [Anaerolineales bacterium]|uniref:NADH-quinone oxidoreductase subunit J n=1 Tax=Candidatus Desulfolinea nitratireducens TaxID=2841698 RepID=A0A8J6NFR0_9CHLR|nr:NADH-quinone oxidoreductase subunit J [Candidatus Desulfolinea nitratireducens]MBL6961044.1 NADH-quinone oxidoreductase subunit J [Anaerolineales bacterium]